MPNSKLTARVSRVFCPQFQPGVLPNDSMVRIVFAYSMFVCVFHCLCLQYARVCVFRLPPDMSSFNTAFNLGDEFQWNQLEYENTCDSETVQSLIGPMMGDLSSVGFIAAPYGSFLRFAEGIDSIRNLAKTGDLTLTNSQRGAAIVCSIAQLGGVIWMAVFVIFLALFCMCAPVGSWCCLRCYRICRGASRRDRRRNEALDDLIAFQYGDIGSAPSQMRKVSRQRVGPQGHLLIDTEAP